MEPQIQNLPESVPNAELLGSLGRLVRGLSALFWGLPIALIVCLQTAKGDWFRSSGVLPPILATGLLIYGLALLGHFQKQERVWRAALDRAKIFGLINLGFSPFLYWWNKIPANEFYSSVVQLMVASALLFLYALNPLLWRLSAMLPDEALRQETRLFTRMNRCLLLFTLGLFVLYLIRSKTNSGPQIIAHVFSLFERVGLWLAMDKIGLLLGLVLILLPVAMTMALIWKIKEVILAGVFGQEH